MTTLEDLVLKRYRVSRIGDRIVATLDPDGRYKACSAQDIESILTNGKRRRNIIVEVTTGTKWYPLGER